jgi:hypothetical protein
MPDIITIDIHKVTFGKGEIMDSIQKIGFSNSIIPYKTIYPW